MTHKKLFFISFAATLAVIIPMYLVMSGAALQSSAAAEAKQTDIPTAVPTAADACTVLLSTGEKADAPERFYLLRFDALHSRIAVSVLPAETQVPFDGGVTTLLEAVQTAGTAQGAYVLKTALGAPIDHVAFVPRGALTEAAAHLGLVRIRLCDYVDSATLAALKLDIAGTSTAVLTPERFAEILTGGALSAADVPTAAAQSVVCLFTGGLAGVEDALDVLFTQKRTQLSTDIDATEVLRLARIARFWAKDTPAIESVSLTEETNGTFSLCDSAATVWNAAISGA